MALDREVLEFVRQALPQRRTVFYDFEDRYAVLLLSHWLAGEARAIADIKASHLAPLLNRPLVKSVLAASGGGRVAPDDLQSAWPVQVDGYRLTLDSWPSLSVKPRRDWHQVTRHGYSLVLQLNLPVSHVRELEQSVGGWKGYTSHTYHPVADDELTLAWARFDLDFDHGEALIEEVQSDWVRDVKSYAASSWIDNRAGWERYLADYLTPRARHWPRTIMTATLWFLLEELGIRRIFYHTHKSGQKLKKIRYGAPPRSLYTEVPRSFCFRLTHNGPAFLRDSKDRHITALFSDPHTTWHVHDFPAPMLS